MPVKVTEKVDEGEADVQVPIIRSLPENIEYRIRLKHASEFAYATNDHSRADVESPDYFHNLSQRYLMVGDVVFVCVLHKDGTMSKATFEVVEMDSKHTVVEKLTAWRTVSGKVTRKKDKPLERAA